MTGADRDRLIGRAQAFSRVTPEHKLVIVRSLQSTGEVVAMLGDGINDAAALKQANVGVAMGIRGTDVAKEAAAIVLQDDRFETVAAAVEEGRVIFDNIRKFVFYLFSCNVAEVLVLLVAGLAGLPLPLAPLQLLWLNMVTDTFPALALAMEPGDPDVMRRPPHDPEEAILSREFLTSVLTFGVLITLSTLAAFVWALDRAPERAPTMAFMTLALAQIAHLGNARSRGPVLAARAGAGQSIRARRRGPGRAPASPGRRGRSAGAHPAGDAARSRRVGGGGGVGVDPGDLRSGAQARIARYGEADGDGRAGGRRGDGDRATVHLDETFRGWQPEAGAARLGREERHEDLLVQLGRDAGPAVGERDMAHGLGAGHGDLDGAFAAHGVRGVDEQVVEDDAEHFRVGADGRRRAADLDVHHAQRGIAREEIDRARQQRQDLDRRPLRPRRARKEQQVLHQLIERVEAREDVTDDRAVACCLPAGARR